MFALLLWGLHFGVVVTWFRALAACKQPSNDGSGIEGQLAGKLKQKCGFRNGHQYRQCIRFSIGAQHVKALFQSFTKYLALPVYFLG